MFCEKAIYSSKIWQHMKSREGRLLTAPLCAGKCSTLRRHDPDKVLTELDVMEFGPWD